MVKKKKLVDIAYNSSLAQKYWNILQKNMIDTSIFETSTKDKQKHQ